MRQQQFKRKKEKALKSPTMSGIVGLWISPSTLHCLENTILCLKWHFLISNPLEAFIRRLHCIYLSIRSLSKVSLPLFVFLAVLTRRITTHLFITLIIVYSPYTSISNLLIETRISFCRVPQNKLQSPEEPKFIPPPPTSSSRSSSTFYPPK